jgi:hypothetical protein
MIRYSIFITSVLATLTTSTNAAGLLEMLDGTTVEGQVTAVNNKVVTVKTDTETKSLQRADVSEVVLDASADERDISRQPGQMAVQTIDGGWVACESLGVDDGTLSVDGPLVGKRKVDLKAARVLIMPAGSQTPQQVLETAERFGIKPGSRDVLAIARDDGKWVSAAGVLLSIDAEKISFRYRGKDRTIDRDTVRAIWLAELAGERPTPTAQLTGHDGCVLNVTAVTLAGETATVKTLFAGELKLPREKIATIRFFSDRVVDLASLEPSGVKQKGFFDTTFSWRRNRAVSGKPLRLDGREYRRGLGLHSFAELTWKLDSDYEALVATVGIDDAVRPAGQATLKVLGDGKALPILKADGSIHKSIEVSGKEEAVGIRIELKGVKTVGVRVEFGPDGLGVGDQVDLVSARLIR